MNLAVISQRNLQLEHAELRPLSSYHAEQLPEQLCPNLWTTFSFNDGFCRSAYTNRELRIRQTIRVKAVLERWVVERSCQEAWLEQYCCVSQRLNEVRSCHCEWKWHIPNPAGCREILTSRFGLLFLGGPISPCILLNRVDFGVGTQIHKSLL